VQSGVGAPPGHGAGTGLITVAGLAVLAVMVACRRMLRWRTAAGTAG